MKNASTNGAKTEKNDGGIDSKIVGFFSEIEGQRKQVVLTLENRKLTLGLFGTNHNKSRKGEEVQIEVGETVSLTELTRLFAQRG